MIDFFHDDVNVSDEDLLRIEQILSEETEHTCGRVDAANPSLQPIPIVLPQPNPHWQVQRQAHVQVNATPTTVQRQLQSVLPVEPRPLNLAISQNRVMRDSQERIEFLESIKDRKWDNDLPVETLFPKVYFTHPPEGFSVSEGKLGTGFVGEAFNQLATETRNLLNSSRAIDRSLAERIAKFLDQHMDASSALDAFQQFRIKFLIVEFEKRYPRCFLCGKLGYHPLDKRDFQKHFDYEKTPWASEWFTFYKCCARNGPNFRKFFFLEGEIDGEIELCRICGRLDHASIDCESKLDIFGVPTRLDVQFYNLPESAGVLSTRLVLDRFRDRKFDGDMVKNLTQVYLEKSIGGSLFPNHTLVLPPAEALEIVHRDGKPRCLSCGYLPPETSTMRSPSTSKEATSICTHRIQDLKKAPFVTYFDQYTYGPLRHIEFGRCKACGRSCETEKCFQTNDVFGFPTSSKNSSKDSEKPDKYKEKNKMLKKEIKELKRRADRDKQKRQKLKEQIHSLNNQLADANAVREFALANPNASVPPLQAQSEEAESHKSKKVRQTPE